MLGLGALSAGSALDHEDEDFKKNLHTFSSFQFPGFSTSVLGQPRATPS